MKIRLVCQKESEMKKRWVKNRHSANEAKSMKRAVESKIRNPDRVLLEKIREYSWTSHNIPLTSSLSTMGNDSPLISDDLRMLAIKKNIRRLMGSDLSGLNCLDLGCLEGGISFEMAREGMVVIGVEGRDSNFRKCKAIEQYFCLPNLRFIHADVKVLSPRDLGTFDVILCCGILYHLDDPFSFMKKMYQMCGDRGILFLDTHFAPDAESIDVCRFKEELSDIEKRDHEGKAYCGRWFHEFDEESPGKAGPWTAVSNYRSFWPTHEALIKGFYHVGFRYILEIFGFFEIEEEYQLKAEYSRSFFLVMK